MLENAKTSINVAVVGAGTVGSGALTVLAKNADVIAVRSLPIKVKWLAEKDTSRGQAVLDELGLTETKLTDNWKDVIEDPDTDIVVELIGGTGLAKDILSAALSAGKSAVTANKDLIATHGGELLAIAAENQTDLFFEASVGGGIPIIQAFKESLAGNHFNEIMGIVNGTTNYILSKMSETGIDFEEALSQAQSLGYAEANPTSDVEGYDAARKMAILSSIAYNSRVTYDMVSCEGITKISKWDIQYAKEFGYVIKMIGISRFENDSIDVRVHPLMLPTSHPLATVSDSYNAIFVNCDALENAMFFGRGAGSLPTGSAIVGDIIAAARNIKHQCKARLGCTCHLSYPILPIEETTNKYYIRISVFDELGVFASISQSLAQANVSMDSVMQKRSLEDGGTEIIIITHPTKHKELLHALQILEGLECVRGVSQYIRVQD